MFSSSRGNGGGPARPSPASRGRGATAPTPPPPLLLMSNSQSLTFGEEDVRPGQFMPVGPMPQLFTDEVECEMDSFVGQADVQSSNSTTMLQPASVVVAPPPSSLQKQDSSTASKNRNVFRMTPGKPQYAPAPLHNAAGDLPHAALDQNPYGQLQASTPMLYHTPPNPSMNGANSWDGALIPAAPSVSAEKPIMSSSSSAPSFRDMIGSLPPVSSGPPPSITTPLDPPPGAATVQYMSVVHHWFYCKSVELRQVWQSMSYLDSARMEEAYQQSLLSGESVIVRTDGGRYDVNLIDRTRHSIYWEEPVSRVRRCSWFYRMPDDTLLVPYDEQFAEVLEECFRNVLRTGEWHKRQELSSGDGLIFHNQSVILHFAPPSTPMLKSWMGSSPGELAPRTVKRGIDDFDNIFEGEYDQVDHLIFIVHGIGPTCDLRFRNIVECVDDMRSVSHQILRSHFRSAGDMSGGAGGGERRVGRVELLPVRWHAALHGDATGIDRKLKAITLKSIGKLRQYTNDTLLDVLFYGSPAYAQKIANTVGDEMNRLYQLFLSRNVQFTGGFSVAGHSLGSLILFDLLAHQTRGANIASQSEQGLPRSASSSPAPSIATTSKQDVDEDSELTVETILAQLGLGEYLPVFNNEKVDTATLMILEESDWKEMGLPLGPRKKLTTYVNERKEQTAAKKTHHNGCKSNNAADSDDSSAGDPMLRSMCSTSVNFVVGGAGGTGTPFVRYPHLQFETTNFFALGSPIAMFLTVRGVDSLGEEFRLPTCQGFFNIFHPFDPVAYRIEPIIRLSCPPNPFLMPHHKGRKRLHLELKDSLSRVGSDLKQKILDSVRSTWRTINDFALAHRTTEEATEKEVDKVVTDLLDKDFEDSNTVSSAAAVSSSAGGSTLIVNEDDDYPIGALNNGRRIDYVLQEKPIESFNDYLFALGSHACYWDSEDTVLLILKEIYAPIGIFPHGPQPQAPASTAAPPYQYTQKNAFPRHPLVAFAPPPPPATSSQASVTYHTQIMLQRNTGAPLRQDTGPTHQQLAQQLQQQLTSTAAASSHVPYHPQHSSTNVDIFGDDEPPQIYHEVSSSNSAGNISASSSEILFGNSSGQFPDVPHGGDYFLPSGLTPIAQDIMHTSSQPIVAAAPPPVRHAMGPPLAPARSQAPPTLPHMGGAGGTGAPPPLSGFMKK